MPIDIDPRALTPHFEGLEGLKVGEDARAKIAASLEGKLETDACTAQLEFAHDANGAPERQWPRVRHLPRGRIGCV